MSVRQRRARGPERAVDGLTTAAEQSACIHLPLTILCERCLPRLPSLRPQKRKFFPRACRCSVSSPPLLALQPLLRRTEVATGPENGARRRGVVVSTPCLRATYVHTLHILLRVHEHTCVASKTRLGGCGTVLRWSRTTTHHMHAS